MSASPSGNSNGRTPTPNGGPGQRPFVRKPKPADPLRPRKKPPVRRPLGPPKPNGTAPQKGPVGLGISAHGQPVAPANGAIPPRPGGWSTAPTGTYQDFPLMTTKRELREGLRYHIAKFASKKEIDPSNQDEFTRPVLLHRRDPRQPPPGKAVKEEENQEEVPVDAKERERLDALKAEKERRRAEDLAQIAPTGNNASAMAAKKVQSFRNEKTTQVHHVDKTPEQKKASDLRYEEALPWHIEDADNKNTWVGNYEAALSSTNVMFVIEGSVFKMVPVEKWYKFTPKNQFKTYTIEEAEAQMGKKMKESRWVMKTNEDKKAAQEAEESRKITHGIYTVKSESNTFKNSGKRETEDMDELDFAADDLFQDDDEQATFEPDNDEDTKEAKEKIKREQRGANVFGEADEAEVDKELEEEKKDRERIKKEGKSTKKALKKRERNLVYESDSDHPYSSSSDDDTSDEEKQAEIDRKKDEEAKLKAKLETKTEPKIDSKLPSGASSKGTNTPSGRPKHSESLKKSKSLKRPGSPNLSESSGNESSRKKHKNKHGSSHTGTSTPRTDSRQNSPAPTSQPLQGQSPRKSSMLTLNVNGSKLSEIHSAPPNPAGSTSDGEATGGEMSDGGRKKSKKLRLGGSPSGSRAASPAPGRAGSIGVGSRAGSPQEQTPAPEQPTRVQSPWDINPTEMKNAIPTGGISIQGLLKLFSSKIGDPNDKKMEKKAFIVMVKENLKYNAEKLLIPK